MSDIWISKWYHLIVNFLWYPICCDIPFQILGKYTSFRYLISINHHQGEATILADSKYVNVVLQHCYLFLISDIYKQTTHLTGPEDVDVVLQHGVAVFLQEAVGLVLYAVSEVVDDEGRPWHSGLLEVLGLTQVFVIQLLAPVLVWALWHLSQIKTNILD